MKKHYFFTLSLVVLLGIIAVTPVLAQDDPIELRLWRFFNACFEEWEGVTEITEDVDDVCAVNQVLAQVWNAENPNIQIETTVVSWPGTTELNAALAAQTPPDIMAMHAKRVPLYASRGALTPLTSYLEEAGIDLNELVPEVVESVSYEGEIYALPFDFHGLLWHINLDYWDQAGLLDADGNPIIPSNLEEFRAACVKMKDVTDHPFVDNDYGNVGASWFWFSLLHQFGGSAIDTEGLPTVNTPEAAAALDLMIQLFNEGCLSFIDNSLQPFFAGEAPGIVNGTWMVNEFEATVNDPDGTLKNYYVTTLPVLGNQPATWADSHVWVVPLGPNADPDHMRAITQYLKFFFDHQLVWARTGHAAIHQPVLGSEAYSALPHRDEYAEFPSQVALHPGANWVAAFDAVMVEEIQAVVADVKSVQQALDDAQSRLMDLALFGN